MKRLIAVLSGLLVLPAFAEVAPISYDEIVEYSDELISEEDVADTPKSDTVKQVVVPVASPSRGISPRSGATNVRNTSRVVPAGSATTATRNVSTRASASSRNATTARTTTTRASGSVVSRNATASRVSARPSRAATTSAPAVTARRATTSNVSSNASRTARAGSIIQTDTVNTPLYTGRVGVRSSAIQARMPVSSGASTLTSATTVATDISEMDELAQITDYCKAQYTACMDDFCNVLDEVQGRCSCSANLKNYEKTQNALRQANESLQDVAQQIQYIGLTDEEIKTVFSQTEAELAMRGVSDNSDIAADLDKISGMVIDARNNKATSTATNTMFDFSGLLNLDFGSDFGLVNMFSIGSDTSSISNQRGEQLYKTATARCKSTVLNTCQAQGVDISVITNAYDLEIDKQCIAYERDLTDANDQLSRTVRNAQTVLQRARLMVAQKKNEYDGLRECITALDSCMQDDIVCGSDYEYCLDPTGKYIVSGKIVSGSAPITDKETDGLSVVWNYGKDETKNAWSDGGSLKDYISGSIKEKSDDLKEPTDNMLVYLQSKIGYYDDKESKNVGMCIGELEKCQRYSYKDGEYQPDNQVVREYMQRALIQIKSTQDEILAEYAENCLRDVSTCLSRNASSTSSITRLGISSCSNVIKTCMSVNGESNFSETAMKQWVVGAVGETTTTSLVQKQLCENSGGKWKDTGLCECTGNKILQDSVCGYVISGGEYALGQTRFVPNVSNAAVSLPELSSWTYTGGQKADCYYVYQNGTEVTKLDNEILPVGFNGTDLSVECGKNTQTEEEKQTECENSNGMVWYNNQCITQAQHNCITSPGTWTGSACQCNPGYKLDNQKCVANTYTCSAGTYLNVTTCAECPAGSYCPGVTNQKYTGSTVGIITCPENSGSVAGASECICHSGYHLDNQKCVANTYTIKYDANGGSGTMSDTTCTYGKTCILADNKFTNTGYGFFAWQYLGSNYAENADVTNIIAKEETLTFQAVWRQTQESCEAAGKKWYNNGYCITEEEYNNAQLCDKDGGWLVNAQRCACPDDTEWVADTGCVSTVYTLTLNQTIGSGGDSTATYKKGGSAFCDNYGWCGQSIHKPYINGYEFQGYFTEKTGGTQWINKDGYPVNTTIITESRTLYAQYKASTYTCSAGTYLNVTTCAECPAGSYCPGGEFTYNGSDQGLNACPENSSSEAGAAWCECDEGYVSRESSEGHTTTSCYAASSCSLDNIKNTMDANPCVLGDLVTQTGTNGNSVQGYLVTGAASMTAEACCAAAGAILSSGSICACEKIN